MEQSIAKRQMSPYLSQKISFLNIFYAALVVLLHANCLGKFEITPSAGLGNAVVYYLQKFICQDLTRSAIPTFFAISGFLFFVKVESLSDVFKNMRKRVNSLLIPYLIFNVLGFLFLLAVKVGGFGESLESFLNPQRGWLSIAYHALLLFEYNGVGWYLFVLIGFVCLTPLLYYTLKDKWVSLITLALCLVAGMVEIVPVMRGKNYTLFFFYLGAFLATHGLHLVNQPLQKKYAWIPVILFVASQAMILVFGFYSDIEKQYPIRFVFEILISVSMWLLVDFIKLPKSRWYFAYSFPIYCTHVMVQDLLLLLFTRLGLVRSEHALLCMVLFLLRCVGGIFVPAAVFKLLKAKLNPVYRVLTGGR